MKAKFGKKRYRQIHSATHGVVTFHVFGELGIGYNSGNLKGTSVGRRTARRRNGASRSAGRARHTGQAAPADGGEARTTANESPSLQK